MHLGPGVEAVQARALVHAEQPRTRGTGEAQLTRGDQSLRITTCQLLKCAPPAANGRTLDPSGVA